VRYGERARNGYHWGELVHSLISHLLVVGCSRRHYATRDLTLSLRSIAGRAISEEVQEG
jgi:hypothetical protein